MTEDESRVWWAAYSASIRNRKGSHPTTSYEAEKARGAADEAVDEYRKTHS